MKIERVFLADPSLKGYSGHCFDYLLSLKMQFNSLNIKSIIIGNKKYVGESEILKCFTYDCDEIPFKKRINSLSKFNDEMVRVHSEAVNSDFEIINNNFKFTNKDLIIINTLRHWSLNGILDYFEKLDQNIPFIIIILHFTIYPKNNIRDTFEKEIYKKFFDRLKSNKIKEFVLLFSDSYLLIEEYQEITDIPINIIPIPHIKNGDNLNLYSIDKKNLFISYIGEARISKGFNLLPSLVNKINKNNKNNYNIHFLIQNFTRNKHDKDFKEIMAQFSDSDNLRFIEDQLASVDYERLLFKSDIILIPYNVDQYHSQTSGIFSEALGLGRPTIVPRGTWMARQIDQFGGGLKFLSEDPEDLYFQTNKMIENFPRYSKEAQQAKEAWINFHSPSHFIKTLSTQIPGLLNNE